MEIPYGYCHCECGQKTKTFDASCASRGHVKGEPRKFLQGHGRVVRTKVVQPSDLLIRYIGLTCGQFCIVDADRYEELMQWVWFARWNQTSECYYAARNGWNRENGKGYAIFMHQYLLPVADNKLVDHKNRNSLDNRIFNLQEKDKSYNAYNSKLHSSNTSGFRGISTRKGGGWEVYITKNTIRIRLGVYSDLNIAIEVRRQAEIDFFGEPYKP